MKTRPSLAGLLATLATLAGLAGLAGLAACSSSTAATVPGPSEAGAEAEAGPGVDADADGGLLASPQVSLSSQLGPGSEKGVNDTTKCDLTTQPWLLIGDTTDPVSDGTTQNGAAVAVECRVAADGSGYVVSAKATLSEQGSVEVSGHFDSTGAQSNIHAAFTRGDTGTFVAEDCTVSFKAPNPNMGIALGRVWGVLDCPHATFAAQSRTCLGTAEFKFENCTQN